MSLEIFYWKKLKQNKHVVANVSSTGVRAVYNRKVAASEDKWKTVWVAQLQESEAKNLHFSRLFKTTTLKSAFFLSRELFIWLFSSENERWYSDKISGKWFLLLRSQRRKVVAQIQYQKRKISKEERRPRQSRTLDTPPSSTSYYKLLQ